jgi:hypothetical protein
MKTKKTPILKKCLLGGLAAISFSLISPLEIQASDAMLMQGTIDIQSKKGLDLNNFPTTTLYKSKKDPNQFYYLPPNLRFAVTEGGVPMITAYKYNLVYNDGNFIKPEEEEPGKVYQGGTLKATFTMGLDKDEIHMLEKALIEKGLSPKPRIARLPLNKAEFSVTLTDPENPAGAKATVGPFPAPVSADIISIQEPLSRTAADILLKIFSGKDKDGKALPPPVDPPINLLMVFDYDGYGLDTQIKVTGKWDNVYSATDTKAEVEASYWFVSTSTSVSSKTSELMQKANIEIEVDGDFSDAQKEQVRNDVSLKILEMAFDTTGLEPAAEDGLAEGAGKAPDAAKGSLFGRPVGVSVGFGMAVTSKGKKGDITYTEKGLMRINRPDARYALLDISKVNERNVVIVEPSDWSVAKVIAEISGDVGPFFLQKTPAGEARPQTIAMTYGTSVSKQTFPRPIVPGGDGIDFGAFPNGGEPKVEVTWNLPFAPWPQVKNDLSLFDDKLNASYSQVQGILRQVYAKKGAPSFTTSGDLRLMSAISLSKAMLPVAPELCSLTVQVVGPDEGLVDWSKQGNALPLMIVQQIEGASQPLRIPLGAPMMLTSPYTISFEPLQAIFLAGPGVISSKLVAPAISVNTPTGGRITKQNVVLVDDLLNGGFVNVDLAKLLEK